MIASRGFEPDLTLFECLGNRQGANNDGTGTVAADISTGNAFDSYLALNLAQDVYRLYLTESDNTAVDARLSDGFTQDWRDVAGSGRGGALSRFNRRCDRS